MKRDLLLVFAPAGGQTHHASLNPHTSALLGYGWRKSQNLGGLVFSPSRLCRLLRDALTFFWGELASPCVTALEPSKPTQFHGGGILLLERFSRREIAGGLIYNGLGE